MSNLTVCRECDAVNTPGSKFCNNCGARLPLSTNLICPNCGTSNPRNRVFCDNCGTRLVKEETPKAPIKPEEAPASGSKAFTLPARPPGETGELDPKTLPDWLRTGDTASADTDDTQDQQSDELPDWLKASLIAKGADPDNLPSLEELTPEKRTTDDLPDWLISAGDTSPIIDSPKEISTEIYLDLVSRAQEAPDQDDPFDADAANLPDWLAEAAAFPDLTSDARDTPNQLVADDSDAFDAPAEPPLPDEVGPAAEGEDDAPSGSTNWLTDADALSESAATEAVSGSGLTDWLTDPDTFGDSDQADSGDETDLTNWLADLEDPTDDSQVPITPDQPSDESSGLTDWLTDPDLLADTGTTSDEASEEVELAGWLADLDQLDDHDELLVDDVDITAEEGTDTLVSLEQADQAPGDLLADALEAAQSAGETAPEVDEPAPVQDLEWLSELADFEESPLPPVQTAVEAEQAEAERPQDDRTGDEYLEAEPGAHFESEPADDWLSRDSFVADDPLLQPPVAEELPEWLQQLGPPLSSQPPDSSEEGAQHQTPLPSEELPDWIASLRPNSSMLGSSLPSALSRTSSLPDPLADIPDELTGAELPDWLQDIPIDSSPPGPPMPSAEEFSAPEWFSTDRDLADRHDAGDATTGQSPAGQEWGNILEDLPPALPLEQTLAKADIPDWVQALKPSELLAQPSVTEDQAESEQGLLTSGPLAGIPGVIAVEPLILKPRSVTTFNHLAPTVSPTAEQQQQVALLRQLALSEPGPATSIIPENGRLSAQTTSVWLRLLLAGILLAAILLGLLAPDLLASTGALPVAPVPSSVEPVYNAVESAAGRPVLVAFEYTPALAGELTPQANLFLAQLEANGSPVVTLSQYPAGTAIAAAASQNLLRYDLGYLPGDALGLRQLGNCLSHQHTCQMVPGWAERVDSQQPLSEVALIILLTGERNSLVNWVEQVGIAGDVPIVAGITQALAPVATPYLATGQLQGVLEGAPATALYEQSFVPDLTNSTGDLQITSSSPTALTAQRLAQLVVATFLVIGGLLYGISGSIARNPAKHRRP